MSTVRFVLSHRHRSATCAIAYAAWKGFDSPLRRTSTLASCAAVAPEPAADHVVLLAVEAASADDALALLPPWVAERTVALPVGAVRIP